MTSPAYVTSKIFGGEEGLVPEASGLDEINYPPVASVTVAYPNDAFKVLLLFQFNIFDFLIFYLVETTCWIRQPNSSGHENPNIGNHLVIVSLPGE